MADVDQAFTTLAGLAGPGSGTARTTLLSDLLGRATEAEAAFLAQLFGGEVRHGALAGVMADAVAKAAGVPAAVVRRAVMLGGDLGRSATVALTEGRAGLEATGLEVGRPVQPMLASTAATVAAAVEAIGASSVEWKLDGIRIQVHRRGDRGRRVHPQPQRHHHEAPRGGGGGPQPAGRVGRARRRGPGGGRQAGRPVMFQDTAGRVGAEGERAEAVLPHFFDVLHVDGRDLIDLPLAQRIDELERVAGAHRIPGTRTDDPAEGETVLDAALHAGHEGVVVKDLASPYLAGRRGKAWRKVKPVHTLDLVVLAVEWGYGRRTGWLSNLHLGARADDGSGFVMVGKTFKGLTDDLLRWQTERFLGLAEREEPWTGPQTGVVWVRPEQVVEIAVDGVQRSTRYPGGVALRFARVLRYREDKDAADADAAVGRHRTAPPLRSPCRRSPSAPAPTPTCPASPTCCGPPT